MWSGPTDVRVGGGPHSPLWLCHLLPFKAPQLSHFPVPFPEVHLHRHQFFSLYFPDFFLHHPTSAPCFFFQFQGLTPAWLNHGLDPLLQALPHISRGSEIGGLLLSPSPTSSHTSTPTSLSKPFLEGNHSSQLPILGHSRVQTKESFLFAFHSGAERKGCQKLSRQDISHFTALFSF